MPSSSLRTKVKFLPSDYKAGDPVNKPGVAEGITKIRHALENMELVVNGNGSGELQYVNGRIRIILNID